MRYDAEIVDYLLEKECYIIDFLPETVPANSNGQFFDVEHYLLNSEKHIQITDKFVNVILKLMCYYDAAILQNECIERANPEWIEEAVSEMMKNRAGTLNCLFADGSVLLVFEWDSLTLGVYNPSLRMQKLLEQMAISEGLFWRLSPTN